LPDFEHEMVAHLREFAPMHFQVLGPDGVRPIVHFALARAAPYGFTYGGPVQLYFEMMFLLGADFDTDPQYPWAARILRDRGAGQSERADHLYDEVMAYVEAAGGPGREYARRALRKAREIPLAAAPHNRATFEDDLIRAMQVSHPEKFAYVGEQPLRALLPAAIAQARNYSIATPAGVSLLAGLMFALGHGVVTDPKYSFIEHTLVNPAITEADRRVERLYSKVMTYLDHVLKYLEA
jgi:hypothetical protein